MGKIMSPLFLAFLNRMQVMITYMRAWMSLKFGQIQPLVFMVTARDMMEKTVSPLSRLFFIRSVSYLQVMMMCMRAWRSSNLT